MLFPFIYFLLGTLFTFLAYFYASETIWNPMTIIFLILATLDFGLGFTFLRQLFQRNEDENHYNE